MIIVTLQMECGIARVTCNLYIILLVILEQSIRLVGIVLMQLQQWYYLQAKWVEQPL